MRNARPSVFLVLASALGAVWGCSSSYQADPPGAPSKPLGALDGSTSALPTETSPPSVYVAKVKNILVGLPPTDDEVKAIEADPSKLGPLIDQWMTLPQYQTKMLRFFELAFQQTQIDDTDFDDQITRLAINGQVKPPLMQNITESFGRTALQLISQGRPFTDVMTTRSFMMTPALMELYGFLDVWQFDDAGGRVDRFHAAHPSTNLAFTAATVIPLSETLNPASSNFMHFYNPALATFRTPGCFASNPVVYTPTNSLAIHHTLQGSIPNGQTDTVTGKACQAIPSAGASQVIVDDDFTAWKMVSVRPPKTAEKPTPFYDLPKLRTSSELVLEVPRVGFFSTPAFFANWHTNTSNQMRVTANQTLIVALGAAVDGTDATHPASTPGLDTTHAGDPACVSCHQTLDPTRSILASNFSWNYHNQTEATFATQNGIFAFQNVTKPVSSLDDFGNTLATHPLFAEAWVQKLCYYANSRKCDTADQEFQRVVSVFKTSTFSWNALVRELLSSPITTNAKATTTLSDLGEIIAVSRRDHLCGALAVRLGIPDVCGLASATLTGGAAKKAPALATIQMVASGLPSDGYGRGGVAPVLPNDPSLFYRAAAENICEAVATLVVDPATPTPDAKVWSGTASDAAITDFVQTIMALTPSDPRSPLAAAALHTHYTKSVQAGASQSDALRSTFIVACLAPTSISVGL